MAAEVPVSDVLCEAMNYLSKLGANLRTRSENLKEKRIRKDKLRNAHALQKAANKVLLICDLSKKSLENVEGGVRQILSAIGKSQASIGDNLQTCSSVYKKDKHYQIFEWNSRKLRTQHNIPLRHYMSAKVKVLNMPLSALTKYPVNCDCKLFRMRKKPLSRCSDTSDPDKGHSNEKQADKKTDGGVMKLPKIKESRGSGSENNSNSEMNTEVHTKENTLQQSDKTNSKADDKIDQIIDSSNSHSVVKVTSANFLNSDEQGDEKSENCDNQHNDNKKSGEKLLSLIQENKDMVNVVGQENSQANDTLNLEDRSSVDNQSREISKPSTIKCVNLAKLLKPEIASKVSDILVMNERSRKSSGMKVNNKEHKKSQAEINLNVNKKLNEEEEYWTIKRKEVKKFKPKKFDIQVLRLPKLTSTFLKVFHLKKITQNGNILCEINDQDICKVSSSKSKTNEIKNALLNESDSDGPSSVRNNLETVAEKIKHTLLNESDSDGQVNLNKSEKESTRKPDNTEKENKKSTSDDTESEKCGSKDRNSKEKIIHDDVKKSLLHDSDEESDTEISRAIRLKNALLQDSDSDTSKKSYESCSDINKNSDVPNAQISNTNDDIQKEGNSQEDNTNFKLVSRKDNSTEQEFNLERRKSDNSNSSIESSEDREDINNRKDKQTPLTPRTKRKRIKKSMKAKRMLLRYSCSSEEEAPEKEQFRQVNKHTDNKEQGSSSSDKEKTVKRRNSGQKRSHDSFEDSDKSNSEIHSPVKPKEVSSFSKQNSSKKTKTSSSGADSDEAVDSHNRKVRLPR